MFSGDDGSLTRLMRRPGGSYGRLRSYQAYLAGDVDLIDELAAAQTAASEMSPAMRAILIGVATGALTLVVNRWLERWLK